MGYTVTVKARTKRLGDKMIAFLNEHMRAWYVVAGLPVRKGPRVGFQAGEEVDHFEGKFEPLQWAGRGKNDNLSYCHRKGHLGWDFNFCSEKREYMFVVVRWMSRQIGDKSKAGHYRYLYDGHEWIDCENHRVDPLGIPWLKKAHANSKEHARHFGFLTKIAKRYLPKGETFESVLRKEMKRLDALWKNR
jgi:hypothetical protein